MAIQYTTVSISYDPIWNIQHVSNLGFTGKKPEYYQNNVT